MIIKNFLTDDYNRIEEASVQMEANICSIFFNILIFEISPTVKKHSLRLMYLLCCFKHFIKNNGAVGHGCRLQTASQQKGKTSPHLQQVSRIWH